MTEEPAFQCSACKTAHHTAKDAMACCRGAERGVSRMTNWPDAIYEATGWVVSDGLAYAIGGMVEAARRDAAGERDRLREEVTRLEASLHQWVEDCAVHLKTIAELESTLRRIGLPGKQREVIALGLRMREAQAAYFKQRSQQTLFAALALEADFDRAARAALGEDCA